MNGGSSTFVPPFAWARAAAVNFAVPLLLAWALMFLLCDRYARPDPRFLAVKLVAPGPVRLRLQLPGTAAGIPEPLVVCGRPGNASLVYIRLLKNARAKVGVEFWGRGAFESEAFTLSAADAQIDFTCALPALLPAEGDPAWRAVSPAEATLLRRRYALGVDGVVRLQGTVDYAQPPGPVYLGSNPIGGSLVSVAFTGKILASPVPAAASRPP